MEEKSILQGHSDLEKGAYLGAIASIASADRSASEMEIEYLADLCDAAELSDRQKEVVLHAATEVSGEDLTKCLDVLKGSDLKYSLVTDLMAFAKSDGDYSEEEQQNVEKIATYLGVNKQQTSLLDEFSDKAKTVEASPVEMTQPGFLSSLGLKDKMQKLGINTNFLKGLLGIAGPMILAGMVRKGLNRGRSGGGLFGGNRSGLGGLGSIIDMLSGGRSMKGTSGLFGRRLGGF